MKAFLKAYFSKGHLLNNIKLKVLSLFLAILLWVVVLNITDPIKAKKYSNVPVRLINIEKLTDNGKTYEILDGTELISTVTIRAPRNTLRELGNSVDNIIATADFSRLSADGTTVPVDIVTSKFSDKIDSIRASSESITVRIENRKTIQIPIQTVTTGEVESGYILGTVTPSQNQVKVSGPESIIDTVKSAKVEIQISGFTGDISTQSEVVLYDESGNIIPRKNISLNVENVDVTAEILATKKVPIAYSTIGMPAEGYGFTGEISCSPETVTIAGPASEIEKITKITIPSSELNITGQSESMQALIDLSRFMPDKTRFADSSFNGYVSFKIYIEPFVEDDIGISPDMISIQDLPEGFTAMIAPDEYYEIIFTGLAQDIERSNYDQLNVRVNIKGLMNEYKMDELLPGEYEAKLLLNVPDNLKLKEEVHVKVIISE